MRWKRNKKCFERSEEEEGMERDRERKGRMITMINSEHFNETPWRDLAYQIKFRYLNQEWQEVKEYRDEMNLATNVEHVNDVCQSYYNDTQELLCYVDSLNYTIMETTPLTQDIYQFITHSAYTIREGFEKEAQRIEFNPEPLLELLGGCVCFL